MKPEMRLLKFRVCMCGGGGGALDLGARLFLYLGFSKNTNSG